MGEADRNLPAWAQPLLPGTLTTPAPMGSADRHHRPPRQLLVEALPARPGR